MSSITRQPNTRPGGGAVLRHQPGLLPSGTWDSRAPGWGERADTDTPPASTTQPWGGGSWREAVVPGRGTPRRALFLPSHCPQGQGLRAERGAVAQPGDGYRQEEQVRTLAQVPLGPPPALLPI